MRPLPAQAENFLSSIDVAARTNITYRMALQTFAEFLAGGQNTLPEIVKLGTHSSVPLNLLQEESLAKFRHWMRNEKKYNRRTENTYLAAAIRFMEWLDAHKHLPLGVTSMRLKLMLKESRGRRRVGYKTQPIKDAVPLLIEYYDTCAPPDPKTPRLARQRLTLFRNRAIVHLLIATGLRAHELASLKRADCAEGVGDAVRALRQVLIMGKGEKERVILLSDEAQAAIQIYLQERDQYLTDKGSSNKLLAVTRHSSYLLTRHDRDDGTGITTKTVWQVVNTAAKAISAEVNVSPHDFRRYIATHMLSEGMPLESVQVFLGHESIVTTRTVYAHTLTEVLEEQVNTYRPSPKQAAKKTRTKRANG